MSLLSSYRIRVFFHGVLSGACHDKAGSHFHERDSLPPSPSVSYDTVGLLRISRPFPTPRLLTEDRPSTSRDMQLKPSIVANGS